MTRTQIAPALLLAVLTWALPAAAHADPISTAEQVLSTGSLSVDPSVTAVTLDRAAVTAALPGNVRIAVLPAGSVKAISLAGELGRALDPNGAGLTVGVLTVGTPNSFRAGSSRFCDGFADTQAQAAVSRNRVQLQNTEDATALLIDFAQHVRSGPLRSGSCRSAATTSSGQKANVWPFVAGALVLGATSLGGLGLYARRRRAKTLDLARAKVMPYYDRLASEVTSLQPMDSAQARQALGDASERFTSAGAQLATADTVEEYALARRTVLEGLYAARTTRTALGLDPGPELPAISDTAAPQLDQAQPVTVAGQTFQGHPAYTPGSPYYFGGGSGVPGGWYGTPFWETLLIGSVLSSGFGGGFGGGSGGRHDDPQPTPNAGGGDWTGGGSSAGDWGSGSGGDWGGSGGSDSGGSW